MVTSLGLLLLVVTVLASGEPSSESVVPWRYECDQHRRCIRKEPLLNAVEKDDVANHLSLGKCRLTCGENAVLWPKPREATIGRTVTPIRLDNIWFGNRDQVKNSAAAGMIQKNVDEQINWLAAKKTPECDDSPVENMLRIHVDITGGEARSNVAPRVGKDTNETYNLRVMYDPENKIVHANIGAVCYYGVRHALETLFQLIEYDEIGRTFVILDDVEINDYPEFSHRGISIDTSRNFIQKEKILKIIDGMAHDKLNVLHWHIVDTHSYPVEQKADPINLMSRIGAYDQKSIYTQDCIREIVRHADFRGVRVIPEFDQPSHIGNGWQLPGGENFTTCLNKEPWYDYCLQPPCGQLNPYENEIYDILEKIYVEWYEMFDFDTFHMGADEVQMRCWNASERLIGQMKAEGLEPTEEGFIKIWTDFQQKSSAKLKSSVPSERDLDIIVWSSDLTKPEHVHNLPKEDYIVQFWGNGTDVTDGQIKTLVERGYRLIMSNWDKVYLDCGFAAYVGKGNNWCTPYKGWQGIYENDIYALLGLRDIEITEKVKEQILGGEVAIWTEQTDSQSIEGRIFPRSSAFAERLWSNPDNDFYGAEDRIIQHRWRLTHRGVAAERLQPEWCRQNSGQCYVGDYYPDRPVEEEAKPEQE